jgi:hypothetical protein
MSVHQSLALSTPIEVLVQALLPGGAQVRLDDLLVTSDRLTLAVTSIQAEGVATTYPLVQAFQNDGARTSCGRLDLYSTMPHRSKLDNDSKFLKFVVSNYCSFFVSL